MCYQMMCLPCGCRVCSNTVWICFMSTFCSWSPTMFITQYPNETRSWFHLHYIRLNFQFIRLSTLHGSFRRRPFSIGIDVERHGTSTSTRRHVQVMTISSLPCTTLLRFQTTRLTSVSRRLKAVWLEWVFRVSPTNFSMFFWVCPTAIKSEFAIEI